MGMTKTNNPIENYNGHFKQQHTQRRLLRFNALFVQILQCCTLQSILAIQFETGIRATPDLLRAYRKLHSEKVFSIVEVQNTTIRVHSGSLYHVIQRHNPRELSEKASEADQQAATDVEFEGESQPVFC
ncbi:hypothetical protein PHMEG_0004517 [Phytophthora megakarya]|uniref:Uncharacterized protein n=1 Tax=Phytophthora megakarya TaxID=4795 RepID=A0A225WTL7_9STRA|nr:hypothetical protein PHMEG_0004517 [Phytophthora megakarya]